MIQAVLTFYNYCLLFSHESNPIVVPIVIL